MNSIGVTYPSILDHPGRSLIALDGFPRNTGPSTIVLGRAHRRRRLPHLVTILMGVVFVGFVPGHPL